jgi:hypothetical protein
MFQIESGIPLPATTRIGAGRKGSKYPFASMETGTSFFVEDGDEPVKDSTLRSAIGAFNKSNPDSGRKFAVRKVEGGVRVWRTR